MERHWWLFWLSFIACVLVIVAALYGCGEFVVGLKPAESMKQTPTTRPYIEVRTGDTNADRWLPYAMTGAALLAWLLPSCWPLRRGNGKR